MAHVLGACEGVSKALEGGSTQERRYSKETSMVKEDGRDAWVHINKYDVTRASVRKR